MHSFETKPSDVGKRVDKYISEKIDISRTRIKSIVNEGLVTCNSGVINSCSSKVKYPDIIKVEVPEVEDSTIKANPSIKLNIVYEDDELLIIDKQAGLTVHPGAGNFHETMVNALMAHCGESLSGVGGVARPGILHRLDKDTSGLILVAKTDNAHLKLSEQIANRTATRMYTALCWGVPKPFKGTIDTFINRNPVNRLKMEITRDKGKQAITHYEVKKVYGNSLASKVEFKLQTGRTHQIRAHMKFKGNPIIGDPVYCNRNQAKNINLSDNLRKILQSFNRQALHASKLGVEHPSNNTNIIYESGLTDDILKIEEELLKISNYS